MSAVDKILNRRGTKKKPHHEDYKKIYYPESQVGDFTDIDGTIAFYTRINSILTSSSIILDFGCGRGDYAEDKVPIRRQLRIFKGRVRKVIGVDVDKSASTNPCIDEFHVIAGVQTGLDDDSIDVCICDNVIEHIDIVESFFFEVRRIIKDQGYLCIRTPNLWNYIAIFSKIVPNKFHYSIITKIQNGRKKEDIFPVYYRCNTISKLNSLLDYYGFKHRVVYGYEAEPSYLSFSRIAYFFGYLHQKFAPNFLKCTIFAFAQLKKS